MIEKIHELVKMNIKALAIFVFSLSLVTFSSRDLIEYVCRTSKDFKLCMDSLRADPKNTSALKKRRDQ